MFNIIIDGQAVQAEEGGTVLQKAKELKIDIPTLCYHDNLSPFGACRLCTVEVKANDEWKLAASCHLKTVPGMEIRTASEAIKESRKIAAALLLYRYPDIKVVREVAAKCGVAVEGVDAEGKDCILCGLCTRACREIVGANALIFLDRGLGREADEPKIAFEPDACIGCGSCAFICPTGYVAMEAVDGKRIIWDKVFHMATCRICGRYFAPMAQLEFISRRTGVPLNSLMTCVSCR